MERKTMWLIGLAILIILGLGGYLVYDKVLNKENDVVDKDDDINNQITKLDINSDQVKKLYNMAIVIDNPFLGVNYEGYYRDNELTNEIKLMLGIKKLNSENKSNVFSSNTLKEYIFQIFGNHVSYSDGTVIVDCEIYNYNESTKVYEMSSAGCGGFSNSIIKTKLTDAYEQGNKIVLTEKVVFLTGYFNDENEDIDITVHPDYAKEKTIGTINISSYDKFSIDNYINEASTYRYIFILSENGSYYLTNFEKV